MKSKLHPLVARILGVYQLLVGGYGALFFAVQIIRAGGVSLAGLVFVALYILVAWAGWQLLKNRPNGATLTLVVQALQVVRVSSGAFAYAFLAGLAFWVTVGSSGLDVPGLGFGTSFRWMASSGFGPRPTAEPFTIGVNLVAAAIVAYLLYGRTGGKKRKR